MDGDAESRLCMRPLVVRFTDPQVDDAHENLVYVRQASGAPSAHAPAEETVRQLKARVRGGGRWPTRVADEQLREREPRLRGRRLRLIHFGRVVADGVRLASWLDVLASRQGGLDEESTALERVALVKQYAPDGSYVLHLAPPDEGSAKQRGKMRQLLLDELDDAQPTDGVVALADVLRLPTVHLQCSVGGSISDEEAGDTDETTAAVAAAPESRGFDRLRQTAGLSEQDVELMRAQFRASTGFHLARSGDVLRQRDEEEHARALEEQWIETAGDQPLTFGESGSVSFEVLKGLLIGFFFPLIPLFFSHESDVMRSSRRRQRPRELTDTQGQQQFEQALFQLITTLSTQQERRDRAGAAPEGRAEGGGQPEAPGERLPGGERPGAPAQRADGAPGAAPRSPGREQEEAAQREMHQLLSQLLDVSAAAGQRAEAPGAPADGAQTPADDASDEESDLDEAAGLDDRTRLAAIARYNHSRSVVFTPYTRIAIIMGTMVNVLFGILQYFTE